jgi:hypothetical protein
MNNKLWVIQSQGVIIYDSFHLNSFHMHYYRSFMENPTHEPELLQLWALLFHFKEMDSTLESTVTSLGKSKKFAALRKSNLYMTWKRINIINDRSVKSGPKIRILRAQWVRELRCCLNTNGKLRSQYFANQWLPSQ